MYWDLGLLPGTSKKWKVYPIGASAGNAQKPALNRARVRRVLASSVYLIQAKTKAKKFLTIFSQELNLQISCVFVFD